jgi:hypothetical protein
MEYLMLGFLIGAPVGFILVRVLLFLLDEFAEELFDWFSEARIGKILGRWFGF